MAYSGGEARTVVRMAETVWRRSARDHQAVVHQLLSPGMVSPGSALNSGRRRNKTPRNDNDAWRALDPKNPIFNFLIEYYGLKGLKGVKRLARWSPTPVMEGNVLLEGASESDLGGTLPVRGAMIQEDGIRYSPAAFFGKGDHRPDSARTATAYLWYRTVLQNTLLAKPILHCHGLHEWAMQYHPDGAPPPPSAKYQGHLPLRVDQQVINETVERDGVHCTHVDALRYFAPAAGPLNHHGAQLQRPDQLRLEQPACVHAHMDLLKMALRLQPFCDATILQDALWIALEARKLDVAASPYDASDYGLEAVPVETSQGRKEYREQQVALMNAAEPIRQELLLAYDTFLQSAFDDNVLMEASQSPLPERYAKAEPNGLPWRKNLVAR